MGKRKAVAKADGEAPPKVVAKKVPKTLRDKILDFLSESEVKVDLPTIKAVLAVKYDFPDSAENKNKVYKMTKTLRKEGKIGKVGNSFHFGEGSLSFATINEEDYAQKDAGRALRKKFVCPNCENTHSNMDFSQIEETLPGSIENSTESGFKCLGCYAEFKVMVDGKRHVYTTKFGEVSERAVE